MTKTIAEPWNSSGFSVHLNVPVTDAIVNSVLNVTGVAFCVKACTNRYQIYFTAGKAFNKTDVLSAVREKLELHGNTQ